VFIELYNSLVQPILTYGTGIWGLYEQRVINTVQNRACRFFLGASLNTSNIATRGDMGWTSTVTKQRLEAYRLWVKLNSMQEDRLPHIVHKWALRRKGSWELRVTKLTKSLNLDQTLGKEGSSSHKIKLLKQKLFILDEQKWFTDLWDDNGNATHSNKLRTYRLFKKDLHVHPEPYVTRLIHRHHRKSFSRLHACSLHLAIEVGRHAKPPISLENRFCPFCPSQVEDEVHFTIDYVFRFKL